MIFINLSTNQFFFGDFLPSGSDWQEATADQFNTLRAGGWNPTDYIPPYRVSKDTIISRVLELGKLPDMMSLISTLSPEQKFLWEGFSWFWNNNQTIISMCQQIGIDSSVVLAFDPYL